MTWATTVINFRTQLEGNPLQINNIRRSLLTTSAVAVFALLLTACTTTNTPLPTGSAMVNQQPDEVIASNGNLDVTLSAAETMVPYGSSTRWAMTYNGKTAGPTLRVHPGDHVTVTLVNKLTKSTSLHTHGLHISPTQDDPFIMVDPGKSYSYTYDIPMDQASGTYWYHPHVHGITAEQVASGLSGAILVENADDVSLSAATTNRVLVINDPQLTTKNPWDSSSSAMGGMAGMAGMDHGSSGGMDMMTAMMGRTGPKLLTNGFEGISLSDSGGKLERLHVVNATASSTLQFSYSGSKMLVLSSEGGRLAAPVEAKNFTLAAGERTEVIVIPGSQGGTLSAQRLSNEATGTPIGNVEKIATIAADAGTATSALPTSFKLANTQDLFAANVNVTKRQVITLDGHMNPTINGKPFDPSAINFTAKKGTVEEWVIKNNTPMYHPIHVHTWGFQVKGETGWQDVVMVAPYTEQVIRVAFDDFTGTTVIHCHVLDHEDTGMMATIKVE